ncbi:MAG TPA: glycosyl hydrolase-related protein [Planctomycetota bacterium]|nr:glycosyl hydrolase-related protein [Planctomycetota bacterium]
MPLSSLIRGKKYVACVIPHTHWDRAWYWSFELFRLSLCKMTRRMLEILENDREYRFTFDGQTVVLEDHLALFPEDRPRFAALIAAKRLTVGPFYVQPDNTLITGESLIRNGIIGRRIADGFGRSSRQGMAPDPFGIVSQVPQIWHGLELESIIFSRGVSTAEIDRLGTVFRWRGADGDSEILGVFQPGMYANAYYWGIPPGAYPRADADTDRIDLAYSVTQTRELVAKHEARRMTSRVLYFGNGVDHFPAQHTTTAVAAHNARACPDIRFVVTDTDGMVALMKQETARRETYAGELRMHESENLLAGTLDARPYLKQQYDAAAEMLEKRFEPLQAWCHGAGLTRREMRETHHAAYAYNVGNNRTIPEEVMERSREYLWKLLLKNAPHDDICGCSRDSTHEDAENRAKRVLETGRNLAMDCLLKIARSVAPVVGARGQVVVFNPLPEARSAHIRIRAPLAAPSATLKLVDHQGVEVPCVLDARVAGGAFKLFHSEDFIERADPRIELDACFVAALPAFGYASFSWIDGVARVPATQVTATADGMRNAEVEVAIRSDGSFDLTDLATGHRYGGLNRLNDHGDLGDLYTTALAPDGTAVAQPGCATIALHEALPFSVTWKVVVTLPGVPAGLDERRTARSGPREDLRVTFLYTLQAGSREVRIRSEHENRHRDHRLTVDFPTGLATAETEAHTAFDVVRHRVPFRQNACAMFATAAASGRRFTIASRSMHSYDAVRGDDGLTLSKCLLKASGWVNKGLVPDWAAPGGDCVGRTIVHDYAVQLGAESDGHAAIFARAAAFVHDPVSEHYLLFDAQGDAPGAASFLRVSPGFELSAFTLAADGRSLTVRVVNMGERAQPVQVAFAPAIRVRRARRTNLLERTIAKLAVRENAVTCRARAKEIVTLIVDIAMPRSGGAAARRATPSSGAGRVKRR